MARQAVNATITNGQSSLTVPGGKVFVGKASPVGGGAYASVAVNGAVVAYWYSGGGANAPSMQAGGPIAANAGDVISAGTGSFGLSGFFYDA